MATALYRAMDWAVIRTPLLPVSRYLALATERAEPEGSLLPADPVVRQALAVGGGDLVQALETPPADPKARARVAGKLARFLIRMSTRPTPYGMFAGVGLVGLGESTDLALTADRPRTRTRPDMGWLLELAADRESRQEIRANLRWWANPAVIVHADRVFLAERATPDDHATLAPMTLRATGVVRRVLAAARTPIPYGDLVAELTESTGAPTELVERLLTQLWEQSVLITDLRPGPTCADPARHVAQRVDPDTAVALEDLLTELKGWDELAADQAVAAHPKLVAAVRSVHEGKAHNALQTDMALPLAGVTMNRRVADEAARAAELLLRMSPMPNGPATQKKYHQAFIERYGEDREVPLLELVHPELGLGLPEPAGVGQSDERRDKLVRDLALRAIRDGRTVVELDESMIDTLQTWVPSPANAPESLDLSVFVLAESAQAVDRGDFRLAVTPVVGAQGAGRMLGRFADLLGEPAFDALRSVDTVEARPGVLRPELAYLPLRDRSVNVTIRPQSRDWTLPVNAAPDGDAVPLDELVVGLRRGRLVLRWPARDVEITPSWSHMLNPFNGSGLTRFLEQLARAGQPQLSGFDWGPAADFPFLPRVQCGRIVLAPATWQLSGPEELVDWHLPRHVYLTHGDNRLLLDLHDPDQLAQVQTAKPIRLEEALPGPDDAWLPGPDGCHFAEIVVPLALADPPMTSTVEHTHHVVTAKDRMRPPGSDWLFLKLYHVPSYEDDLLTGPVRALRADVRAKGLADNWFFMRYVDPDPHLRLRWHGDPTRLATELAPEVMRWASDLVADGYCHRFALDTYDREVERYGGVAAMAMAEEVFGADSDAVLDLLHLQLPTDRGLLAARTVDDLLECLGIEPGERATLYRNSTVDRRATGPEYRTCQRDLVKALTDPDWPDPRVAEVLARRRERITGLGGQFDLHLARSYVHMHCNRLLGCGHPPEQRVLGLLARARQTLAEMRKAAAPIPGSR